MATEKKTTDMIGRWLALAAVGLGVTEPGSPGERVPDARTGGRSGASEEGPAGGTMVPGAGAAPVTDGPFIETKEALGCGAASELACSHPSRTLMSSSSSGQ